MGQHAAGARPGHRQDFAGEGVGVPVGQEGGQGVRGAHGEAVQGVHGVPPEVGLAEHDPLGHARGAGSVDEHRNGLALFLCRGVVGLLHGNLPGGLLLRGQGQLLPGLHGNLPRRLPGLLQVGLGGQHQFGGAVLQDEGHFVIAQGFADGDGDGAQFPAGVEEAEMVVALGGDGGHPVAGLDALFLHIPGPGVHVRVEFAEGDGIQFLAVGDLQDYPVRVLAADFPELFKEVFAVLFHRWDEIGRM